MPVYFIEGVAQSPGNPNWPAIIQHAHDQNLRPLCGCINGNSKALLCIVRYDGGYYLRRMPLTAAYHAAHCEHYEPPMQLSGLGHVHGSAIKEDATTNLTALSLDFPLTRGAPLGQVTAEGTEHESVRADGLKLTLRGTLHYLYDKANLSQWYPAMAGKRSWFIVRRELMQAAATTKAKGDFLSELLFIPETFRLPNAQDIANRRVKQLARLNADTKYKMLIVGEVKSLEPGHNGHRLTFKHLANESFRVAPDLNKRIEKVFAAQFAMWKELENTHLLLIGTFSKLTSGIFDLESTCFMNVNQHWIPFDSQYSYQLITHLHNAPRPFRKSLRYNLKSTVPMAMATLLDTGTFPTALYAHESDERDAYAENAAALLDDSKVAAWFWQTDTEAMPALPAATRNYA